MFSLGALLYLVDSGYSNRIDSVVSVSGGSITNAAIAQGCDVRTASVVEFDPVAARVVSTIVKRGVLFSALTTWAYAAVLGILLCYLVVEAVFDWPFDLPGWALLVGLMVAATFALARGQVLERLLAREFFRSESGTTHLADVRSSVEHVFAATDLNSGAPVYMSSRDGGVLESPVLETAPCAWMRLSSAVRASAAFPGGFPPKRIAFHRTGLTWKPRTAGLESFERPFGWFGRDRRPKGTPSPAGVPRKLRAPRSLFLSDGGVWNNLATDWHTRHPPESSAEILLVVDASAPLGSKPLGSLHVPGLGEIVGLGRIMTLLYANTVEPRVVGLEAVAAGAMRTRAAGGERWVLPVLARIIDGRAEIMLRHRRATKAAGLPIDRSLNEDPVGHELQRTWTWLYRHHHKTHGKQRPGLRLWNSTVPTTLGRVDRDTAQSLLLHGYMTTATALHLFARLPFPGTGGRLHVQRFNRLLEGDSGATPGFMPPDSL